jgi:uroporphyrinogen III methyltransferase/synthase
LKVRSPRITVTLAAGGLAGLDALAGNLGVVVVRAPLVHFAPPASWDGLDRALAVLETRGTPVFTSPRAAAAVAGRIALGRKLPRRGIVAWAIGPVSAGPLLPWFGPVRLSEQAATPEARAEALGRALLEDGVEPPVIHLCGTPHRPELAARLRRGGIEVRATEVYRCLPASAAEARRVAAESDRLVVGSETVVRLIAENVVSPPPVIAIGATTATAARRAGLEVVSVATSPDAAGVAAAIAEMGHRPQARCNLFGGATV